MRWNHANGSTRLDLQSVSIASPPGRRGSPERQVLSQFGALGPLQPTEPVAEVVQYLQPEVVFRSSHSTDGLTGSHQMERIPGGSRPDHLAPVVDDNT